MPDFKILSRNQIDSERWNNTVQNDSGFRHYALTYFLDACAEDWLGIVQKNYEWVWPLPIKKFPVVRVYQPLQAQQLGPFGRILDSNELQSLWQLICAKFSKACIQFSDHYSELPIENTVPRRNLELSLANPYDQLIGGYKRSVITGLRKADSAGIEVLIEDKFDPWCIEIFKRYKAPKVNGLNSRYYQRIEMIFRAFLARGQACCVTSTRGSRNLSQALVLNANNRMLFFFSGSTPESRETGAMVCLIDRLIQTHCAEGRVLDFEGSNNYNLARFYKSFGAHQRVYLQASHSRLFWPLNKLLK